MDTENKNWHSLEVNEVLKMLSTSESGLTDEEVKNRIRVYGKNDLPKKKKDGIFKIMFRQLMDPILILLIFTVVFSFMIDEVLDAVVIIFILVVDLVMGTVQEWKAGKNAEALVNIIKEKNKVIRNGKELLISSSDVVPGDIVLLESGCKVSADLRIISCNNLLIDESVLTGESVNVSKTSGVISGNNSISDRKNMAFAGTSVITGRAVCVAVETGINTEIGKIANKVNSTKEAKSPLTIRMEKFSKQITLIVIIIAIVLACLLLYKGTPGSEIFLIVIALSVSAMPEGLPLALTMALTIASNRMFKENVIVKKLNSVESLGSCTVIASDKTGTLTVNEQTAKQIILPSGETFEVTGTGYNVDGEVASKDNVNMEQAYEISKCGVLNNEAEFADGEFFGDSIDIAFLVLGKKMDVNTEDIEILGSIPYESENKYSAVFYKQDSKIYCTVKGSIDVVMNFSSKMYFDGKEQKVDKELLINQNDKLSSSGYRVIALANGEVTNFTQKENYSSQDINDLTFIGSVAFIDPIRKEAKGSVSECLTAGIKVIMITGDHPLTAYAIGKELGLVSGKTEIATGLDVEGYLAKGQDEFDKFVKDKKVFARVTPLDKLEIVQSLKRQGEFVAVTGDGVNDAPAIKVANIGIAMESGTDVAKETATMIIKDDNFTSIVKGIKEGRTAYSNIRKISYMLLSCSFAEVLFFLLSIVFNLPMPLVAIQLLWLNLVTDGLQDLALSFEKAEKSIMKQKPRRTDESLFNKDLFSEVAVAGTFIGLTVFAVWVFLIKYVGMEESTARGYIVALMVFMQNIHVLNCKSEKNSIFKISLTQNPMVLFAIASSILLQIIIMEVPFLSRFLQTTSVPVVHMLLLFACSCLVLVVMEIYKYFSRKRSEVKNPS